MFNEIFNYSKSYPDKSAIITNNINCTYKELASLIIKIEEKILSLSLRENNVIAVDNKNFFHFVAASVAIIRKGFICLPLSQDKDLSSYLIKESNARYLLRSINEDYNSKFNFSNIEEYSYRKKFPRFIQTKQNNKPAILYPTSGTSGKKRKIVVQGRKALDSSKTYISKFMKLNHELIEFIGSPPDNVFWFGRIRCCLGVGGTVILNHNSTNPIIALSEIKNNDCNAISGDTSFHLMLMKFFKKRLSSLSDKIKWIKLSSQSIPKYELIYLLNLFPKAQIVMGYGLTEAMRTTLIDYRKDHEKLESVGKPQEGVKIKLIKNIKEKENFGEIVIRGNNLALGYLNSISDNKKKFIKNNFHTGDYGKIDKDGYLFFKSRLDSVINIGGASHSSEEILSFIQAKISKCNAYVVGIDGIDDILGTVPILLVEKNVYSKIFFDNLMKNSYKSNIQIKPRAVYNISMIPRTKNGKIKLSSLPKKLDDLEKLNKVWSSL